ncbi:hypothetical protein BV25DRAFT_1815346, partial [Artomyces pyxidatus]
MVLLELRRSLMSAKCSEGADVQEHIDKLSVMQEKLAGMGDPISDNDFTSVLQASLPPSFDTFLEATNTTLSINGKTQTPAELVSAALGHWNFLKIKAMRASKTTSDETALSA